MTSGFVYMNILAIDYGTKNIGLAWAQIGLGVVLPFGKIEKKDEASGARQLVELIKKEKIDKVVVGLPLGMGGEENKNTERVRRFIEEVDKQVSVPIEFVNEVFSSQAADRMSGGASRDEKSAMVILQSYLEKIKKQ